MFRRLPLFLFLTLFCVSAPLAQFGEKVQYFPQFAVGAGAESQFSIHNPRQLPITVEIELRRSDGSLFRSEAVEVGAGATVDVVFSDSASAVTDGWAQLSSDGEFTATLFYRIEGVGNVGVLPSDKAEQLKVFNFASGGTRTGFAVANPDPDSSTDVSFKVFNDAGQLQGEGNLQTLGPSQHSALFLDEPPFSAGGGNGTVELFSTRPVVAVALRLDPAMTGLLLAGVPVILPGLPIRGELNDVSPNIIGGSSSNRVGPPPNGSDPGPTGDNTEMPQVVGATISGGGSSDSELMNTDGESTFLCLEAGTGQVPCLNQVTDNFGTVGGGAQNQSGYFGTVGGGFLNTASGTSSSTVGGGFLNTASGSFSTVGGGSSNTAGTSSSTVGGGNTNTASGHSSTVGGGSGNTASGFGSTVPGGSGNIAQGQFSFAAGNRAEALHSGTFVWSDSSQFGSFDSFVSTGDYQFLVRAVGGVGINTNNNTPRSLTVRGFGNNSELIGLKNNADQEKWHLNLKGGGISFTETGVADFRLFLKEGGNVGIGTGNPQWKLDVNGALFVNGAIHQEGTRLHSADYVFEEGYDLQSIEEHAEFMWREKHLPAVGAGDKDGQGREYVEYGSRMRGILEELEKAHIYIEQLNDKIKSQQEEMENLKAHMARLRETPK